MTAQFVFPQPQNIVNLIPITAFGANVASLTVNIPANPFNMLDILFGVRSPDAVASRAFIVRLNNDAGANYDSDGIGLSAGNPIARTIAAATNLLGASCNGTLGLADEYATYNLRIFNNKQALHKQGALEIKDKTAAAANDNFEHVLWRWRNVGEITSVVISMAVGLMDATSFYKVVGHV